MAVNPREYAASFDERIRSVIEQAAGRIPAFAQRVRAAGLAVEDLSSAESLDSLPVLTKDEVLDHQTKNPPFGGMLAPDARVRRVFQSPGPIYEPELDGTDPWRWAPALEAAGFGPEDVVLNTFSYHLSPAGAMFEEAARAVGCRVLPGGVGNQDLQMRASKDLGVTAYIGLPSYLKSLIDKDGVGWGVKRAFVAGEPLPPSLRSWLLGHIPTVLQGYGTAEIGNIGYECKRMNGFHVASDAFVEVCSLDDGKALWDGTIGQVVVTLLRPDYPLVRLGTGDLSSFLPDGCKCGIRTPRLTGWLGRVGEAVKVRGMFLHPRQVEKVMKDMAGVVLKYRFLIDRVDHKDLLRCEIVTTEAAKRDAVARAVRERVRAGLRFDVEVSPVATLEPDAPAIVDVRVWD